jgi:hypothetical protein
MFKPDLTPSQNASFESIARRCARGVRGCTTDDQYTDLIVRIVEALAFVSGNIKPDDHE